MLATLNQALLEQSSLTDHRYLTAIYLSCVPAAASVHVTLCAAGHDPPLLRRADGETTYVDARGTLLGAFEQTYLNDVALELAPGDQLLLYTDGVIDSRRAGERFGEDRLLAAVAGAPAGSAQELADAVDRAVMEFNDGLLPDDAAIVALVA